MTIERAAYEAAVAALDIDVRVIRVEQAVSSFSVNAYKRNDWTPRATKVAWVCHVFVDELDVTAAGMTEHVDCQPSSTKKQALLDAESLRDDVRALLVDSYFDVIDDRASDLQRALSLHEL